MTPDAIAALLVPYLGDDRLSSAQVGQLATYLGLLVRWNARTNLTSVREPGNIVSRHFGESLFAARHLFPAQSPTHGEASSGHWPLTTGHCADLGSGAGFPGLPLKIWVPSLHVTLIESQNKKATFLREVIRALQLKDAEVFDGRGEHLLRAQAQIPIHESQITNGSDGPPFRPPLPKGGELRFDLVTLRAVERFESAIDTAIRLLAPGGRLALLIGSSQVAFARNHARHLQWSEPLVIPLSTARVLLTGTTPAKHEPEK